MPDRELSHYKNPFVVGRELDELSKWLTGPMSNHAGKLIGTMTDLRLRVRFTRIEEGPFEVRVDHFQERRQITARECLERVADEALVLAGHRTSNLADQLPRGRCDRAVQATAPNLASPASYLV